MRTFTTRSFDAQRCAGGFTFLELLVVVTLVAILTGTVVLGFSGADTQQEIKGFAQRFAYRVELARQQALQRNREWGVYVDERGYRFAEFDPEVGEWIERARRPFGNDELPDYLRLRLETEGVGELPFGDAENLPRLLIFSSGEVTPFMLLLRPDMDTAAWEVRSDGLSPARARREGAETEGTGDGV